MDKEQEEEGIYDDLPMPRWAAFVGWVTTCAICLGLAALGRCVGHAIFGDGFKFKVDTFDIVLSVGIGTFLFFKTRKRKKQ